MLVAGHPIATTPISSTVPLQLITADHIFNSEAIESLTELSSPSISQHHFVATIGLESLTELSSPSISQHHFVATIGLESLTELSSPSISQQHSFSVTGLESLTELSTPAFSQQHSFSVTGLESLTELSVPSLIHIYPVESVYAHTEVSSPYLTELGADVTGYCKVTIAAVHNNIQLTAESGIDMAVDSGGINIEVSGCE